MEVSVIIPSYQRARKLAACIQALAFQSLPPEQFEVLVGLDGPDVASETAALEAWAAAGETNVDRGARTLRVITCERAGYNAVRNQLLRQARGRFMVSLNDDVVPEPQLLAIHLREQQESERRGRAAIITGYSPWRKWSDETLFDRLVRQTSMIFFYDQMFQSAAEPGRDWGFRHCWGLNFSAPLEAVRAVGLFTAIPLAYGYDDIEIGWRLQQRFGMPVLFRPEARAEHDHRYQPGEVLDREYKLGQAAWHFAELNPSFAAALFGRDVRSEAELSYSEAFVEREAAAAARLKQSFLELENIPGAAIAGDFQPQLINLLYQQHLLLKRHSWRSGLLSAADRSHASRAGQRQPALARA